MIQLIRIIIFCLHVQINLRIITRFVFMVKSHGRNYVRQIIFGSIIHLTWFVLSTIIMCLPTVHFHNLLKLVSMFNQIHTNQLSKSWQVNNVLTALIYTLHWNWLYYKHIIKIISRENKYVGFKPLPSLIHFACCCVKVSFGYKATLDSKKIAINQDVQFLTNSNNALTTMCALIRIVPTIIISIAHLSHI